MRDATGKLMYVGKATSLKSRVASYFTRPASERIARMVQQITSIDWQETPTAIEALMLEAALIKKHQPPYNVMEKDDKSFSYLVFTKEPFPRPQLIRGRELTQTSKKKFLKIFGPFTSASSVRASLDALRPTFPWSTCQPQQKRRCFYRHLGLCPGVCTGEINSKDYKKIISRLIEFFEGKRTRVVSAMEKEMDQLSKAEKYEAAAELRDRLAALGHVRDFAVLKRESPFADTAIDVFGRIEAYDISNTLGEDAVGSMVVFEDGEPKKSEYRKFKIKTVSGANDYAMMEEVLRRRFAHDAQVARSGEVRPEAGDMWPRPNLIVIDGGAGQVGVAKKVLDDYGLNIPLVGLAKGPDRKQDVPVYDSADYELARTVHTHKKILQHVRDEAHRFAVGYHRKLRGKEFIKK